MNPKKPRNNCLNCGEECKRPQSIYCSNKCQLEYQYKESVRLWKAGKIDGNNKTGYSGFIKRYFLKKYDNKCQLCGWNEINPTTDRVPLAIHHINGDWQDNIEKNIQLLCPNCHSLTPTYGILNKGNGRPDRSNPRKQ